MCNKDRYIPVCFSPSGGRCRNSKLVQRIVDGKIVDVRRQEQTLAASGTRNAAVYKKDRNIHVRTQHWTKTTVINSMIGLFNGQR